MVYVLKRIGNQEIKSSKTCQKSHCSDVQQDVTRKFAPGMVMSKNVMYSVIREVANELNVDRNANGY